MGKINRLETKIALVEQRNAYLVDQNEETME
jgi:hypothetical protein